MSVVKISNRNLVSMYNALKELDSLKIGGMKFFYGVAKNQRMIANDAEILIKLGSDLMQEYETARMVLCKEHAKKDEGGNPIFKEDRSFDIENFSKFNACLSRLQEELLQKNKELEEVMNKEVEMAVHKIKLDQIPFKDEKMSDGITKGQLVAIFDLIEEE